MIAYANMKDGYVEAYDESGNRLWSNYFGSAQIVGSTATTVSVKNDGYIEVYDENGSRVSSNYVG